MKKLLLRLSVIALALVFGITLASCDMGGSNADLKISFFFGGYGSDWIYNAAERFEAKTGKTVEVVKSADADCGATTYIASGSNLSDIYFGEGLPWKSWVQEGKLEDLSDVYNATITNKNGETKQVKDFMDQQIIGNFYSQRRINETEFQPYAMPWTAKVNAMAYNKDVLEQVVHQSTSPAVETESLIDPVTHKWVGAPKTYQDLEAFCADVAVFNNNSAEKQAICAAKGQNYDYSAIGWCGSINADSVGFLAETWWAEAQGLTTSNYQGEGSFYDFFNYGNTVDKTVSKQSIDFSVYRQSGLELAYNKVANILIDSSTGKYKNTYSDPYNTNLQTLQKLFVADKGVTEKPILSIAASYLENEVIKNQCWDSDGNGEQDCNFLFMNVPTLSAESDPYLYLNFSDAIIVPAKAAHKDLAKEFLIFISTEEEVCEFTKDTNGGIRPFNYDVRSSATGFTYSAFTESLLDVYYNSVKFYDYPVTTNDLNKVSKLFRYEDPGYHCGLQWLVILDTMASPGSLTPGQAVTKISIEAARKQVSKWTKKYSMVDVTDYTKVLNYE